MADVQLNPYLGFRDNAKEAMEFYESVFDGTLEMSTFKEFQASQDPSEDDLIMHSTLTSNEIVFMAADTPKSMEYKPGTNMSMSLSGQDDDVLTAYFDKLSDGGTVDVPLEKAPWGDKFGMLTDKFGIKWMVNVNQQKD